MKAPDGRVLDANLALLLKRAYVPALPRPGFRDRLEAEWLGEVRRAGGRRRRRAAIVAGNEPDDVRPGGPLWPWRTRAGLYAAAAVVLFLVGAFALLRALEGTLERAPDAAALVARGEVAVRQLDSARWRAATGEIALAAPGLEIRTPDSVGGDVRVIAPDGTVALEHTTHAALVARDERVQVRLDQGALLVQRRAGATSPAWTVTGDAARVTLEEGRLRMVLREGERHVHLLEGSAACEVDGEPRAFGAAGTIDLDAEPTDVALTAAGPDEERQSVVTTPEEPLAAVDEEPAFHGLVVDADGAPLPDFRVALLPERTGNSFYVPRVHDFVDADGRFRVEGMRARRYTPFVHAEGFALVTLPMASFDGETDTDLGTVTLTPGGTVRGFVVDTTTGNAVPDAVVLSEKDVPASGVPFDTTGLPLWLPVSARTAADGSFELAHLSPGRHVLRVTAPGHGPVWTAPVTLAEEDVASVGTLALGPGATLEGTARHPDGTAFVGAQLIVSPMTAESSSQMNFALAETDAEGRYRIEDLPEEVLLTIFLGDHSAPPDVRPVQVLAGRVTVLDFPDETPGTRLSGRILRGDGTPLAHRNLTLTAAAADSAAETDWQATSTDADGRYAFEAVEPGDYALLEVDSMGAWLSLIDVFAVPDWGEHVHDVRRPPFAIEGRALDDVSGEPVEGCFVILEHLRGGERVFAGFVRTDAEGRYAVEGLPGGAYELTSYPTTGLGFATSDRLFVDEGAARVAVEFRHGPGVEVEVAIVDTEGAPVAGALVEFLDDAGRPYAFGRSPVTNSAGRHTAVGVRPGRFQVRASLVGFETVATTVELRAGRNDSVRIELKRSGD